MSKNVFHHMPHVCDLLFVIEKYFHDRFHVVCWTSLIDLLPVNKEMRGLHVDGERKVRYIFDSGDEAGVGIELVEIANNDGAVTRTLGQVLERRSELHWIGWSRVSYLEGVLGSASGCSWGSSTGRS